METSSRYLALDVLRGMTIVLMILVNTPGSWQYVYAPLKHAVWHGLTPADLVFPFFLFVAGVSLCFSLSKYPEGLNKNALGRIGRRVLLIFALGLFLNSFPQWATDYSHLRIMGVLQRIALAYGLAVGAVLFMQRQWLPILCAGILLAYWGILNFFGGADPYSLEANAVGLLDRALLGETHLYRGFGLPFDPEGLLSTLPAAVTVLIGYLAGGMIHQLRPGRVVSTLALGGLILAAAGYVWGFVFPLNKPLWTSSYVLYTAGLAGIIFALLIYLIDIRGMKKWTPAFLVFGGNPLFLFLLSGVLGRMLNKLIFVPDSHGNMIAAHTWLFQNVFAPLAGNMNGSLLFALTHVGLMGLVGFVLYRRRIFIKV